MSNNNHPNLIRNEKKIKLKPIELHNKKKVLHEEGSLEEQYSTIKQKIQHAKTELQKLEKKQFDIVQETERKVKQELKNWEEEKNNLRKEAKQLGYNEGFAEGKAESMQTYEKMINEANHLIKTAKKDYEATVANSTDTIIELAIHTAEKIIGQHIHSEPSVFKSIVQMAIKTLENKKNISIYIHPSQFDFLIKQKDELMSSIDGQAHIEIFVNNHLKENSCIIEHPFGQIDASIDTQLEQIRSILQNVSNGE